MVLITVATIFRQQLNLGTRADNGASMWMIAALMMVVGVLYWWSKRGGFRLISWLLITTAMLTTIKFAVGLGIDVP